MFKWQTFRRTDYWGIGAEICIQYDFLDEAQTEKITTGIALVVCLITREFRLGYFWGGIRR